MASLGEQLRTGREAASLTIEEAAALTRIPREHLASLLGGEGAQALSGRPGADMPDPGPVVCSCFSIGRNTICRAIESDGLTSVEQIGGATSAGTNCGSCKAELGQILAAMLSNEPAE